MNDRLGLISNGTIKLCQSSLRPYTIGKDG